MFELTLSHETNADLASTWRAWTDAPTLNSWYWPDRLEPVTSIELEVGGRWRIESPVGEMAVGGEYTAIDPLRLLAFTWQWDGEDAATRATVTFDQTDDGCAVTVVHSGFTSEEDLQRHIEGWTHCLSRMPN